jgi:rare lipoprotein A (peptidoglycan hydrolase)
MQTVPRGAGGAIPRPLFHARTSALRLVAVAVVSLVIRVQPARSEMVQQPVIGHASWYGEEFARRPTASGERYDPSKLTGAHRTLPLGSKVRVTNLLNGRSVMVTINDRGPYMRRREIDLSYGAARALGMVRRGVARVRIELVES